MTPPAAVVLRTDPDRLKAWEDESFAHRLLGDREAVQRLNVRTVLKALKSGDVRLDPKDVDARSGRTLLHAWLDTVGSNAYENAPKTQGVSNKSYEEEGFANDLPQVRPGGLARDWLAVAELLLDAGVDPWVRDKNGRDVLDLAMASLWAPLIDRLLAHPGYAQATPWADRRLRLGDQMPASYGENASLEHPWVHLAATTPSPRVLARLLAIDPSQVDARNAMGHTALHRARHPVVVEALIAAGADPAAVDHAGKTPEAHWLKDLSGAEVVPLRRLASASPKSKNLSPAMRAAPLFSSLERDGAQPVFQLIKEHRLSPGLTQGGRSTLEHAARHAMNVWSTTREAGKEAVLLRRLLEWETKTPPSDPKAVLGWAWWWEKGVRERHVKTNNGSNDSAGAAIAQASEAVFDATVRALGVDPIATTDWALILEPTLLAHAQALGQDVNQAVRSGVLIQGWSDRRADRVRGDAAAWPEYWDWFLLAAEHATSHSYRFAAEALAGQAFWGQPHPHALWSVLPLMTASGSASAEDPNTGLIDTAHNVMDHVVAALVAAYSEAGVPLIPQDLPVVDRERQWADLAKRRPVFAQILQATDDAQRLAGATATPSRRSLGTSRL